MRALVTAPTFQLVKSQSGPTAAAAKTAEHVMAIAGMFFTGLIAGMILFSITRALRGRYARTLGLAMGIVMGVLVGFISHQAGQTASTGAGLSAVWVIGIFCYGVRPLAGPINRSW